MAAPWQQCGVSEHAPEQQRGVPEHAPDEADKHDHTTYCWTNRKKLHGNNKCGTCDAFTVICKRKVKQCKWCLAQVAYENDASLCQACCDEDDELADFAQRLQQVDTAGPSFYRSMTLPGPHRKYRQWTPRPSDDAPTAVDAAQPPLVASDLQRRVDMLEAELARRGQVEADLLRRIEALEGSVGAWKVALQSTPVSWTDQLRDDRRLRDGHQ